MTNYANMSESEFGEALRSCRNLQELNSLHLAITDELSALEARLEKLTHHRHTKRATQGRLRSITKLSGDLVTLNHYSVLALNRMQRRKPQHV